MTCRAISYPHGWYSRAVRYGELDTSRIFWFEVIFCHLLWERMRFEIQVYNRDSISPHFCSVGADEV